MISRVKRFKGHKWFLNIPEIASDPRNSLRISMSHVRGISIPLILPQWILEMLVDQGGSVRTEVRELTENGPVPEKLLRRARQNLSLPHLRYAVSIPRVVWCQITLWLPVSTVPGISPVQIPDQIVFETPKSESIFSPYISVKSTWLVLISA